MRADDHAHGDPSGAAGRAPFGAVGVRRSWYALLVVLGGASYGVVSPLVKMAYAGGFSAGDVAAGQFYYAAALLWLLAVLTGGRVRFARGDGWRMAALGVLGAVTSVAYYRSLHDLPVWLSVILLFQFSWITPVIDRVVARRRLSRGKWIGVAAILAGTALAAGADGGTAARTTLAGVLLGLASGVSYAAFLYISGSVRSPRSPFSRAAIITTVSLLVSWLLYPPTAGMLQPVLRGALPIGAVALFSQAVPTTLFSLGIPRVGGAAAAILGSVELPVAVIAAALMLRENVSWQSWAGVVLILSGIAFSEWPRRGGEGARAADV